MIEGLRTLPRFHEAVRRDPTGMTLMNDCERCKRNTPRIARQAMACGFEAPAPAGINVDPGRPDTVKAEVDDKGVQTYPLVCCGYTARLPEVLEIARARRHWDNGTLTQYFGSEPNTSALLALEVLAGAIDDLSSAVMTPKSKGGLAEER